MEEGTGDSEDEGEEIQENEQLYDMLDQVKYAIKFEHRVMFDDEGPQLGVGGGQEEEEVEVQGGGAQDRGKDDALCSFGAVYHVKV